MTASDLVPRLLSSGFSRVIVLRGADCGISDASVLLALMTYEAEAAPDERGAWIHPYYFASQKAYRAANAIVREAQDAGLPLTLRDELRVKPIFARMPCLTQGRNTISCAEGIGSRFHVQIFALDEPLPPTDVLTEAPHGLHCGSCTRCMEACPTGALDAEGFHRDRCLRNWQLGGAPVPEALRDKMGSRLIGCDACQRCCPHNPPPRGESRPAVPLERLLTEPKAVSAELREQIGANLALPNRVLAQACLLAGCSGRAELLPLLEPLTRHPSPAVREHAAWAAEKLKKMTENGNSK